MIKSNGGIIGPDNVTTGGAFGTASGVFKLGEVTDLINESKWPTAGPQGFQVANSARFNSGSSDYLNRTPSSAGNRRIFTFSFWVKRATLGTSQFIYNVRPGAPGASQMLFATGDKLQFSFEPISKSLETNRVFRDTSAWYHIVYAFDTTQGTASNRIKLYVNGVQETSFGAANYPDQNADLDINTTNVINIGRRLETSGSFIDMYLSEFVFIDGQALAPTSFGEFNSQTGIWVPKVVTGLTFGTNGFYLPFTNASALGEDFSGEDNDFTVNNLTSLDQTTDTCTNNFATLNPLMNNLNNLPTLSEGNLEVLAVSGSTWSVTPSTIGLPKSGKWYYEVEVVSGTSNDRAAFAGWINPTVSDPLNNGSLLWRNTASSNSILSNNSPATGSFSATTWGTNGNIIGMYIDMDNSKLYFAHNGTIQNSGTGIDFQGTFDDDTFILPVVMVINTEKLSVNFGNPAANFAIASGNTDVNGFGNFEFDPSSGTFDGASKDFLAICTKNLAEYG